MVIGGYDGQKAYADTLVYQVEQSGLNQQQWSSLSEMPEGRFSMAATNIADIIFMVGGTNILGQSLASQEYFPLTDEWLTFQQLSPNAWTDLSVVPIGSHVFILGGKIDGEPTDQALSYQAIFTLAIPIVR